uniref:hypothetical protein n=1 Tax=Roseivirga sp. TaxID=1964215 RepID=UPI0040481F4E
MSYTLKCPQLWVVIIATEVGESLIARKKNVVGGMPLYMNDMRNSKSNWNEKDLNVMNDIQSSTSGFN